jgi:serine/threonine-protein kinase
MPRSSKRAIDAEQPNQPSAEQPETALLQGRYVLGDLIGRGTISKVYRATDLVLDRPVAVKLLHPSLSCEPRFVERFLEMERRVARLFHPNLTTIFDAEAKGEVCFVVMEFVPGGSLAGLLAPGQALPPTQAVRIAAETAAALQVLHDEGLVHGDVKPDNILLDEDGSAKLADFGIAHLATTSGVFKLDNFARTAAYLSPEQVSAGQCDARSDVYALGAITYHLLTGREPFSGEDWVAIAAARLAADPLLPSFYRPALRPELDEVVLRALAREPSARFQSAQQFRLALCAVDLGGGQRPAEAVAAEPDLPTDRAAPRPAGLSAEHPLWAESRRRLHAAWQRLEAARADWWPLPAERAAWTERLHLNRPWPRPTIRRDRLPGLVALLLLALLPLLPLLLRLANPPRPVQVPELTGQPLESVRATARQGALTLVVDEQRSEATPSGMVMSQQPPPGSTMLSDEAVRVVVSSGPPPVRVPDLRQRRLEDARGDLAAVGLTLGKVDEREAARQPWGTIVEQRAQPGSELARGGAVDVTVATAPWSATPRLIDRSLGEAETDLERHGLRLGAVRLEPGAGRRAGTVVAQQPEPGVRLRQGESVALTIAIPPSAVSSSAVP